MCGVFQLRLVDILYRGNMELRGGEERVIMNTLRRIGEGAREIIKLYVEVKGVAVAARDLRQTNILGFYGRGRKCNEMPLIKGRDKDTQGNGKGKKRKKGSKNSVVLRKGGYEAITDEGGTVRWEFITG